MLGIAKSTECVSFDGFIKHNCVRSIVMGSSTGYCGSSTVQLVTGVL